MKIHLIAIGGSIMHNLAITLQKAGHLISGSDDEIYEPARSRLAQYGLLPTADGWFPDRIEDDIDLIILGMHARADNPELQKAKAIDIPVHSFPEFVSKHAANKRRVVVAGSHGKTSTTSILLHVLKSAGIDFDYLVGAQLEGFETMVRLTDAPLIVLEGDEYLSSSIDRVPKIWHYEPHIAIITGIAWDHMNVFPTWESYVNAFRGFLRRLANDATIYFDAEDDTLQALVEGVNAQGYHAFTATYEKGKTLLSFGQDSVPIHIFGRHNLKNLRAAYLVLHELGITDQQFIEAISTFRGAAKRLQLLYQGERTVWYQDFAHAPSKVRATTEAVRELFPSRKLTACVELHTYSSLNREFLPQYKDALQTADQAIVFYSEHTLQMKKMPSLSEEDIKTSFGREDLHIITESMRLSDFIASQTWLDHNLLLMSSGNFGGLNKEQLLEIHLKK